MKRCPLFVATLLTVGVTGLAVRGAGWFDAPAKRPTLHGHPRSHDPMSTPSALRWQQGHPTHWRACLMQH
jgi:hypothetical protein